MKFYLQKLAVFGSLLSLLATGVSAQVLYNANSWEPSGTPAFDIGSIVAQDGWEEYTPGVDGTFHRITGSTMLGSLTITPLTGTQMHRSTSSAAGENLFVWKNLNSAYMARTTGNNTVIVTTDIFMPSTDSASDHEHGIICYDPTGSVLLGGFTVVNLDRGFVLYGGGLIGAFGGVYIPGLVPRDAWTRITTILDYDNNTVEAYLNGRQVTFTLDNDPTFRTEWPLSDSQPAAAFNEADLMNWPAPIPTPITSNLFTDNYQVEARRSLSFEGEVVLDDVPNFDDAFSPVFAEFELRDSVGSPRSGLRAVRLLESTGGSPAHGRYSVRFHDVPDGNYKLYIKGERHLSRLVDVTVSGSGVVTVPTVRLLGGDANSDDAVDVLDLDILIRSFDRIEGDPGFNANADFNYDDSIDVLDLDIMVRNFDKSGEGA